MSHSGADEEAGAFEAADDVRVKVGDGGPVGLAEAPAVGGVDHAKSLRDHAMVSEHLADLTGADEVAELVDAVLDAFDGIGQALDRRVQGEADRGGLELDQVGATREGQPVGDAVGGVA